MKNILGIMWEENSTAALVQEGRVVACVSEERFSRMKNDERFPAQAIQYVLKAGGIKAKDLDAVAFCGTIWRPDYILTRRYSKGSIQDALREQREYWYPRLYQQKQVNYFDVFKDRLDLSAFPLAGKEVLRFISKNGTGPRTEKDEGTQFFQQLRRRIVSEYLGIDPQKIIFTDHHRSHAAYAYYASPLRGKVIVLTADAWGDDINATVNIVKEGHVHRIYEYGQFILGRLYRYITLLLGMKPNEHEYKVMGLAPYAKEKYYQHLLKVFEETQYVKGIGFDYKVKPRDLYFYFKEKFEGERFDAIAGALQRYTEDLLTQWTENVVKKTGLHQICFAGGTAMNVKANMMMRKLNQVKEIFVCPSPSDESQSIGAAFVVLADYCKQMKLHPDKVMVPLENAYLGPSIDQEEIEKLIQTKTLAHRYKVTRQVKAATVAKLLAKGKVVARAAGRSEFGARALGNRSILADPRNPDIVRVINEKIKNRDFWMPFAATVLASRAADYLVGYGGHGAPYMTTAFETTALGRKHLRAGLHPYDFTCRPQVVQESKNPGYHAILKAFERESGVGGLLNTSFNLHGEPIVQTAKDAYRVFRLSDLDALLLNNTLLEKKG